MSNPCPSSGGVSVPVAIVQETIPDLQNKADQAFDEVQEFVETITQFNLQPVNVDIPFVVSASLGHEFQKPPSPEVPAYNFQVPESPGALTLLDTPNIDFGQAPSDIPQPPSLNLPAAPGALDAMAPGAAPALSAIALPDAPSIALPDFPVLRTLTLPAEPLLTLPTFTAALPTFNEPAPGGTFAFSEAAYDSALLTRLRDKVSSVLESGYDLPTPIWDMIWNRGRLNEQRTGLAAVNQAYEESAARGFSLPSGILLRRVQEARDSVRNAENSLSRDIAIQRAEQQIDALRFATAQGVALENVLIDLHQSRMQRALQAQQFAFQVGIDIFNAKIGLFNAQLEAYATQAQVYRTQIEAEISKLQLFQAQLDAQRLIGDINQQDVEIYRARIQALLSQVELYNSQIAGVEAQVDVDRNRIESFKALVEAYGEQVAAKTSEYDGYTAQIRGELAKTELYRGSVEAFGARTDAYRSQVEAKAAQGNYINDTNNARVQQYLGRVEVFKAQVEAQLSQIQAQTSIYEGQAEVFRAELGAETARIASDSRQYELALEEARSRSTLTLESVRLVIEQLLRIASLERDSVQAVTAVKAQLAASAYSALNVSAGISGSTSYGEGCTTSHNFSYQG